jgi:hypothetical protein
MLFKTREFKTQEREEEEEEETNSPPGQLRPDLHPSILDAILALGAEARGHDGVDDAPVRRGTGRRARGGVRFGLT